jgi:hypothetical protein
VVSARTLLVLRTLAAAALANSASFRPSTADGPQRVVIFINVVGCGTDGRPKVAWKWARNGSKNTGSSNSRSTASSSAGSPRAASGNNDSHNVGCAFTVLNIDGLDPYLPYGSRPSSFIGDRIASTSPTISGRSS